jgi:Mlc titration factor MtfA (ptsG expression regulator)
LRVRLDFDGHLPRRQMEDELLPSARGDLPRRRRRLIFDFFKRRRRERIVSEPFPREWRAILERDVPRVRTLNDDERRRLEQKIQIFLAEKPFEGCNGLTITDEIRVTIAAEACFLLLGRDDDDDYPALDVILVYPSAYRGKIVRNDGGVVIEGETSRLGESWSRGVVVLAWDDVLRGARAPGDGHDVVLHEFAHQLDQEDGAADGAPLLPDRRMYGAWSRVLGAEYARLVEADEEGKKTLLDKYGATDPAEFFAVATETFFERPQQMKKRHPELYEQLAAFYRQDPASR